MRAQVIAAAIAAAALAACAGGGAGTAPAVSAPGQLQSIARSAPLVQTTSVLNQLSKEETIGSTVDPVTGDSNPYGLDVAKVTSGDFTAGDLAICDFNNKLNVQGTGTSIVALHPTPGSTPLHVGAARALKGCDAIALAPDDTIWTADYTANDAPIISTTGHVFTSEANRFWWGPWGEAFVGNPSEPAFYVSNAQTGDLVRISLGGGAPFSVIISGFPVNGGVPGSILGPSGLNYDAARDRLYVVDGQNDTLYAFDNISTVRNHGITVNGLTFSGPDASHAHVIYWGAPLNGPISSAILPGGNVVLGNTLDPNGKNLMVEISPAGALLGTRNVDTGAAGALFGIVATGTSAADTKIFFNDDNDNTLKVLTH